MWSKLAAARRFGIPEEELERMTPVLDELERSVREALDRDLSTVDPAFVFRPEIP
jgi:hypothetical protein